MIYSDRLRTFLYALEGPRRDSGYPFDALRSAAKKDGVPIIRPEMERFLQVLLELKRPEHILEVGTAIGYSAGSRHCDRVLSHVDGVLYAAGYPDHDH